MKIHLPSLSIGMLVATILAFLMAADRPEPLAQRFQLQATPTHVFVLDRYTGKVWQKYAGGNTHSDQDFSLPKVK